MKNPQFRRACTSFENTVIAFAMICAAGLANAQVAPSPSASATPPTPDVNATILQYQTALRTETQEYRRSLQEGMDQVKWVISIAVPVVGGIFLLLNWKSGRDIRSQVNARFKVAVEDQIEQRMAGLDSYVEENRKRIEQTDQFLELIYDLTFAFHVLSVKLDDPEWDAARRDAERRLQEWRRQLPDSRRLAILLGRLYKHFCKYDAGVRVLTEVMAERDKRLLPQDGDYAALLYNRACYETLQASRLEKSDRQARALRNQAWKDINFSIALEPDNKAEAEADPDFASLWQQWPKEDLGSVKLADIRQKRKARPNSFFAKVWRRLSS
jgi:sulfur transfer complex TusBCD TusB component (DsrH family)